MSLGLAKDSVGDLLKLAAATPGVPLGRQVSHGEEGQEADVPVKGIRKESISDSGHAGPSASGDYEVPVGEGIGGGGEGEGGKGGGGGGGSGGASVGTSAAGDSFTDLFGDEVYEPLTFSGSSRERKKLWCCLLPRWMSGGGDFVDDDEEEEDGAASAVVDPAHFPAHYYAQINSPRHLENGGAAAPDSTTTPPQKYGKSKSILRRGSMRRSLEEAIMSAAQHNGKDQPLRRSFLPDTYKENPRSPSHMSKRVHFSPFARRANIRSHRSMTEAEKAKVWWQVEDFDQFKYCNSTITMANTINKDKGGKSAAAAAAAAIWLRPNQPGSGDFDDEDDDAGKWWHRYGHSRRGLEQFVSGEEARQRQHNVRMGHYAVFAEQERQRLKRRDSKGSRSSTSSTSGSFTGGPEEAIARVAREFSAWAKDLAFAAAASDADAVKSGFHETRKSREFYLLKHTLGSQCAVPAHTPQFMMPPGVPTRILDQNTSSSILYRKRLQKQQMEEARARRTGRQQPQQAQPQAGKGGRSRAQEEEQEETISTQMTKMVAEQVQRAACEAAKSKDVAGTLAAASAAIDEIVSEHSAEHGEDKSKRGEVETERGEEEPEDGEEELDDGEEDLDDGEEDVELNDSVRFSSLRLSLNKGDGENNMSKKAMGFGGGGDKTDMAVVMTTYNSSGLE